MEFLLQLCCLKRLIFLKISYTHSKYTINLENENNLGDNTQQNLLTQISTQTSPNKYLYNIQLNRITNSLVIKPHIKWEQETNNIN